MTKLNIKAIADEVTRGFTLVEGPKMVDPADVKRFVEAKGKYHIPIFPSVARAFPVILPYIGMPEELSHMHDYFTEKTRLNCQFNVCFPINAQQKNAIKAVFKIETAGMLVDALRKYANGEDVNIWGMKHRDRTGRPPIDTPDNGFVTKMIDSSTEMEEIEKLAGKEFTIEQLKSVPKELIRGAFYQKFLKEFADHSRAYTEGLRKTCNEGFKEDGLINVLKACRNLHEWGIGALKETENTPLTQFPTWIPSDGRDIRKGDFIQGIFNHNDRRANVEGNVTDIRENENEISLSLENSSSSSSGCDGQGRKKLEGLLLPTDDWYCRIWKFVQGDSQ